MKILIFGLAFAPELTGIGKYSGEMASWLTEHGNEVDVICGMPFYPEWRIFPSYRKKLWHQERKGDLRIHRCPLYVPKKPGALKRILHEFSFLLSSLFYWIRFLFANEKFDVIICVCPPFHLVFPAIFYAAIRGCRIITHIQDLQVDVARELKMIKNPFVLSLLEKAERFTFLYSDMVSTISPGMKEQILRKGVPAFKVYLFPNWVNTNHVKPLNRKTALSFFNLSQDAKVILYSGNLGEKQGLEHILEVAMDFKDYNSIVFLIVGSGGSEERLKAMALSMQLKNVIFLPLQSYEKLPVLLNAAYIHLVIQKKEASDLVMPSKLTGILASGGFSIVSAVKGSSLYSVLHDFNLGLLIEPDSTESLRDGIKKALKLDLEPFRKRSRDYAIRFLGTEGRLHDFMLLLEKLRDDRLLDAYMFCDVNPLLKVA